MCRFTMNPKDEAMVFGCGSQNRNSKMACPGKWKHGPSPAVCPSCFILSHAHFVGDCSFREIHPSFRIFGASWRAASWASLEGSSRFSWPMASVLCAPCSAPDTLCELAAQERLATSPGSVNLRLSCSINGCGSKFSSRGYAGFSLWFHIPRCPFGIPLF